MKNKLSAWEIERPRILSKPDIKCETCKAGPKDLPLDAYHMGVFDYDPEDPESAYSIHIFCQLCHIKYSTCMSDLRESASWLTQEQLNALVDFSCDLRGEYLEGMKPFDLHQKMAAIIPMLKDFTIEELKAMKQAAFVFQSLGRRKAKDSE